MNVSKALWNGQVNVGLDHAGVGYFKVPWHSRPCDLAAQDCKANHARSGVNPNNHWKIRGLR